MQAAVRSHLMHYSLDLPLALGRRWPHFRTASIVAATSCSHTSDTHDESRIVGTKRSKIAFSHWHIGHSLQSLSEIHEKSAAYPLILETMEAEYKRSQ